MSDGCHEATWEMRDRKTVRVPNPPLTTLPHAHALFEEAEQLINGPRKSAYGHYTDEAKAIAAMWTELLRDVLRDGARIEPRKVPLMMIAMKLNRMKVKAHHDSVADTVGYAGLLAELEAAEGVGVV
jgi:hypothetical protein